MNQKLFLLSCLFFIILLSNSCSPVRNLILRGGANYTIPVDFPELQTSENGTLLKHELINTLTIEQVKKYFPQKRGIQHEPFIEYGVELYRIYYSSENLGEPTILSGLIAVPVSTKDQALAHYQYHHGTLLPVNLPLVPTGMDAPSLCDAKIKPSKSTQFEMRVLGLLPASNGYFVSMPDYAGYSISQKIEHPYGIAQELGSQSIDMIKASQAFAKEKKINLDGQLYLSGWSEGGYAAVATHKMIEEEYPNWNLKSTAALAGPYNFTRFIENVLVKRKTLYLPLYNWAFYSAFEYSGVNIPKEDVWKYEVNNQLDALAIPFDRPRWVYKKKFRKDFTHNPFNAFRQYANKHLNLHEGWAPKASIHFYTGTQDEIVPSFNSMDAYEGLKKAGGNVYYHPLQDESHLTATQDFVVDVLKRFNK